MHAGSFSMISILNEQKYRYHGHWVCSTAPVNKTSDAREPRLSQTSFVTMKLVFCVTILSVIIQLYASFTTLEKLLHDIFISLQQRHSPSCPVATSNGSRGRSISWSESQGKCKLSATKGLTVLVIITVDTCRCQNRSLVGVCVPGPWTKIDIFAVASPTPHHRWGSICKLANKYVKRLVCWMLVS